MTRRQGLGEDAGGARWLGLSPAAGQHFLLDTGTLNVLGYYREIPALNIWNAPIAG